MLILPIALLVIALVAFIAGYATASLLLDYVSIAAGALAFLVVVATARLGRAAPAARRGGADRRRFDRDDGEPVPAGEAADTPEA